jgi:hypothetical protein
MSMGLYEKYKFPDMYIAELNDATDKLRLPREKEQHHSRRFPVRNGASWRVSRRGFPFISIGNDHHILSQATWIGDMERVSKEAGKALGSTPNGIDVERIQLARRMSGSRSSPPTVLAKARVLEKQGRSVIHLEIGEPDFPTPAHIVEAGKRALDEGWTKYGPTPGFPEFREAIAAHVSRSRGIKVGADNVCVVPGGKPTCTAMVALLGRKSSTPTPVFRSTSRWSISSAKPV